MLEAENPTPIVDMTAQNGGASSSGHGGISYKIIRREAPQHYPIASSNIVDLIR